MKSSSGQVRQDARITRSRAALRAALLALLERHPLADITAALVSQESGTGYATFFRHYADVRELLFEAVADLVADLSGQMFVALAAGDSRGAARVLTDYVTAHERTCRALLIGAGDEVRTTLARRLVDQVAALPDPTPAWLPSRLAIRFAIAGTVEALAWWLEEEPTRSPEEVAGLIDRLIIAQIGGGEGVLRTAGADGTTA